MDVSLQELSRMAADIVYSDRNSDTTASQIFNAVAANKNATASDYMNAINEIQRAVSAKYRRLNLE